MSVRVALCAIAIVSAAAWADPAPSLSAEARDVHGVARIGTRSVPSAVIWLTAPASRSVVSQRRPVLDQRSLEFSPHVLAVHVGAVVDFPNHDRVFHNVFSFKDGKRFDLGMYPVAWCARSPSIGQDSAESSAISTRTWPRMSWPWTLPTSPCRAVMGRSRSRTSIRARTAITRGVQAATSSPGNGRPAQACCTSSGLSV